jgi:tetratricopeptide (TPR) repeat protein
MNGENTDSDEDELADVRLEDSLDSEEGIPSMGPRHLRAWLYSLTTLFVIFLGAGGEVWSCSVALMLMGVTLCLAPPRFQLRPVPRYLLIWLALVPAVSLFPGKWFGPIEPWRTRLTEEWSVAVSSSLSPDFQLTLETWVLSLFGLIWLWSCFGQNFSDSGRRTALRLLAFGCMVIGVFFLLEVHHFVNLSWWPHFAEGAARHDFGPFSNRNHSSSLFAMASVLCAAACFDAMRRKSRSWLLFFAGVILFFICIVSNTSRGGLMLFLVGLSTWVTAAAMKKGHLRKILVSFSIIGTILCFVLASKGFLGERLLSRSIGASIAEDTRARLAEETLSAVILAPWLGRGLGVFEYVFPQVTPTAMPLARAIHPESDLLWLLFEDGLMVLIPGAALTFWFVSTTGPWFSQKKKQSRDSRSGRRMRKSFAIVTFMALIHGVFDVPMHGFGYFLLIAFIASLAVRPRYAGSRISLLGKWFFRLAGLAMISSGGYGLLMFFGAVEASIPSMAPVLHDRALIESAQGRRAEALVMMNRAIELSPLDYRFYFLRAELHLVLRQDRELALLDFGRARAVEPRYADFCMDEGEFWMRFDPSIATIPWREFLQRYEAPEELYLDRYWRMVASLAPFPDQHLAIWRLASHLPLQLMCLIQYTNSPHWETLHAEFLTQHPGLADLNENQTHYFFSAWQQKSEKSVLLDYIQKYPRLQKICWRLMVMDLAQSGQFESAYKLAAAHVPAAAPSASITVADIPSLERAQLLNPLDMLPGIELYYAQRLGGNLKSARLTLERVMKLPKAPDFLKRELASLLAEFGDFRGAWDLMRLIIEATPVESSALEKMTPEDDGMQRPTAPAPRDANSDFL